MNRHARSVAELAITTAVGFMAYLSPVLLNPPSPLPKAPLFPLVRAAVEQPHPGSFVALAVVGLLAGFFARAHWALLGLFSMAAFPICTVAELSVDSTSHNLFPIEFVMYGIYSIPAILGAGLTRLVRPRIVNRNGPM